MAEGFDTWMKLVDRKCQERHGLSIYDLPDACFADFYEDGYTPAEAVREAIRAA
jgi:hypothetical protein